MAIVDKSVKDFYGTQKIMEKIEAGLKLEGKDINSLTVDDLLPVDEFHTRGRKATREMAELTELKSSDHVLDIGCGLGGTARYIAKEYKCTVKGIDLTEEYISVGTKLSELVNLNGRVELRCGSAVELPYEDEHFDVVWTQHVQMNVADKNRFYSEIARVLKPGGRLLFHDVFRGSNESPYYPTPWAENETMSFLVTETDARSIIEAAGLEIDRWIEKVQESIEFFERMIPRFEAAGLPPLGIHLLLGEKAIDNYRNYLRGLSENRLSIAVGLAHKRR